MGNKNEIRLAGRIVRMECKYNTTKGIIEVERRSGTVDRIPFIARQPVSAYADWVSVKGKLQTRNIKGKDGKTHKHMYVYAERIVLHDEYDGYSNNEVEFVGTIVHKDQLRTTPLGKTVMDIIVAINDEDGSQYPAVIVWGNLAVEIECLPIGTEMHVNGRFQSREYMKETEEGTVMKTAYEISVMSAEVIQ